MPNSMQVESLADAVSSVMVVRSRSSGVGLSILGQGP
jgi:hypothetical protein